MEMQAMCAGVSALVDFEFSHSATWRVAGYDVLIPCGGAHGYINAAITPFQLEDVVLELAIRGYAPAHWSVLAHDYGPGALLSFGGTVGTKLQLLLYPIGHPYFDSLRASDIRCDGPECYDLPGPATRGGKSPRNGEPYVPYVYGWPVGGIGVEFTS